jgi:hypothetical protein
MTKRLELEFNSPVIQTTFQATSSNVPGGNKTQVITWESPRLTTEVPYPGRPRGGDRAICRTVNGFVNVKFLNKEIFLNQKTGDYIIGDFFTSPFLTMGLYGESAGIVSAIAPVQQLRLDTFTYGDLNEPILNLTKSNGDIGSNVFSSYGNLMQNIFIRVCITRGYWSFIYPQSSQPLNLKAVPVEFSCSGALIAAEPR